MVDNPIKSMKAYVKLSQDNIRLFRHENNTYVLVGGYIVPRKAFEVLLIHTASNVPPSKKTYRILYQYISAELKSLGEEEMLGDKIAYEVKRKLQMPPEKPDYDLYAYAQGKPPMYYLLCYEKLLGEQNVIQNT